MTESQTDAHRWLSEHDWVGYVGVFIVWLVMAPFYQGGFAQSGNLGTILLVGFGATLLIALTRYMQHNSLSLIWLPVVGGLAVIVLGSGGVRDLDCADFTLSEDAQSFVDAVGWLRSHNLDADSDGVACERERQQEIDEGILNPDGSVPGAE